MIKKKAIVNKIKFSWGVVLNYKGKDKNITFALCQDNRYKNKFVIDKELVNKIENKIKRLIKNGEFE